jgi:hypothetical protein
LSGVAGAKAEAADAKPKRIAVENFILDVGEIISGSEIEEMLRPSHRWRSNSSRRSVDCAEWLTSLSAIGGE